MLYSALALFAAVSNAKLSMQSANFLASIGIVPNPDALRTSCIKDDQCYFGSDPSDCCAGHVVDSPGCTESLACPACKKAAKMVVSKLIKAGCVEIIPEGVVACEAIGLGPEDPFADLCALTVAGSCPAIAAMVTRGIKDPGQICQKLNICKGSGGGVSGHTVFGVKCGCVKAGSCTYHESGCCSSSSSYGLPCVPPLAKCN